MPVGFGSQAMRFETRGVGHPRGKTLGTCIAMSYLPRMDPEPCAQTSMLSKKTTVLILPPSHPSSQQKKLRAFQAIEQGIRGPGYYGDLSGVAYSARKIHTAIAHPGSRFARPNKEQLATPGPGRYRCETAPAGVSHSTKGIMDGAVGRDNVGSVRATAGDSGIAPGQYCLPDMMLRSAQGTRGPYDCYSGPRILSTAKTAASNIGPAQYTAAPLSVTPGALDIGKGAPRFRQTRNARDVPFYDRYEKPMKSFPENAPFGAADIRDVYVSHARMGTMQNAMPPQLPKHDVGPNQYLLPLDWATNTHGPLSSSKDWAGSTNLKESHKSALGSKSKRWLSNEARVVREERLRVSVKYTSNFAGGNLSFRIPRGAQPKLLST